MAQDWGGRGTGWGVAEDGCGGETEWMRADVAPRPQQADCAVEATVVDGRLGESGCDEIQ
jgi:hypothetical protein